jgi:hypothetical protein
MPVDRARVLKLIEMIDNDLKQREQDQLDGVGDENEDEPPCDPLDAPAQVPFSDGTPQRIHGEGKEDQIASPWGEKPKVPIPIEHL